jgi:hypothetical protein
MRSIIGVGILALTACVTRSTYKPDSPDPGASADAAPADEESRASEEGSDAGPAPLKGSSGGGEAATPPSTPASVLPPVCGGAQGTFSTVKKLSWFIAAGHKKYVVRPGQLFTAMSEPAFCSSTFAPAIDGEIVRGIGTQTSSAPGIGPFNSSESRMGDLFARAAFPETDLTSGDFGWSALTRGFFDVALMPSPPTATVRVAHQAASIRHPGWVLIDAHRSPSAQVYDDDRYVSSVRTARGFGWVFSLTFDAECKAKAYDDLASENALGFLKPVGSRTRQELSDFLVANGAVMKLSVFHTGAEDPAVKSVLANSPCSPVDLNACEATMKALDDALDTFIAEPPPSDADYASIVDGTSQKWPIAQVHIEKVPTQ